MFEVESEDYAIRYSDEKHSLEWWSKRNAFQKGAELGYAQGYHDAEEHYLNEQHRLVDASKQDAFEVHDMLKNPQDLPDDGEEVIVSSTTCFYKAVAVFHKRQDGTFFWASMDELIENHSEGLFKWCRIPAFSEETKNEND